MTAVSWTAWRAAGLLALFAIGGVGLVAGIHALTEARVSANEYDRLLRNLNAVLPQDRYDNDPILDAIDLHDPELLPPDGHTRVYRAFRAGRPVAAVFAIVAPDGYNGAIRLLMAVNADGAIAGVRVLDHKETPGLGDDIDIAKSAWITDFIGAALDRPDASGWKVKKDGGAFDQFTGATITPRAVVAAVHRGLRLFRKHRHRLLRAAESAESV